MVNDLKIQINHKVFGKFHKIANINVLPSKNQALGEYFIYIRMYVLMYVRKYVIINLVITLLIF